MRTRRTDMVMKQKPASFTAMPRRSAGGRPPDRDCPRLLRLVFAAALAFPASAAASLTRDVKVQVGGVSRGYFRQNPENATPCAPLFYSGEFVHTPAELARATEPLFVADILVSNGGEIASLQPNRRRALEHFLASRSREVGFPFYVVGDWEDAPRDPRYVRAVPGTTGYTYPLMILPKAECPQACVGYAVLSGRAGYQIETFTYKKNYLQRWDVPDIFGKPRRYVWVAIFRKDADRYLVLYNRIRKSRDGRSYTGESVAHVADLDQVTYMLVNTTGFSRPRKDVPVTEALRDSVRSELHKCLD